MAGNQASKDKYLKEKVDTVIFRVPKGQKEIIQNYAKDCGMSLNAFIVEAIQDKMNSKK